MSRWVKCAVCRATLLRHPDEDAAAPKLCADCWDPWRRAGAPADVHGYAERVRTERFHRLQATVQAAIKAAALGRGGAQ